MTWPRDGWQFSPLVLPEFILPPLPLPPPISHEQMLRIINACMPSPKPAELSSRGNRDRRAYWPAADRDAIAKAIARHERKLRAAAMLLAEEATKVAGEEIERAKKYERLRQSDLRAFELSGAEYTAHIHDYQHIVATLTSENNRRMADADAQLNEMRRAMANAITDRDAVRKERDEAVATAERLRAGFKEVCAEREQLRAGLTSAQQNWDSQEQVLKAVTSQLSSARAANETANEDAVARMHLDYWINRYLSGDCRARTAVRELATLRGLSG